MEEISIGDFVLSGGEPAAITLIDACVRLLPGVIGATASLTEESFEQGLLEYPHYTRPQSWQRPRRAGGSAVRPSRENPRLAARPGGASHARPASRPVGPLCRAQPSTAHTSVILRPGIGKKR